MVTMTFDPSRRAEIVAHVPAEQARIRDLRAQGAVDVLSIAEAQDRVWLVVRGETLDAERLCHKDPNSAKPKPKKVYP
jgi:hypothetical protein